MSKRGKPVAREITVRFPSKEIVCCGEVREDTVEAVSIHTGGSLVRLSDLKSVVERRARQNGFTRNPCIKPEYDGSSPIGLIKLQPHDEHEVPGMPGIRTIGEREFAIDFVPYADHVDLLDSFVSLISDTLPGVSATDILLDPVNDGEHYGFRVLNAAEHHLSAEATDLTVGSVLEEIGKLFPGISEEYIYMDTVWMKLLKHNALKLSVPAIISEDVDGNDINLITVTNDDGVAIDTDAESNDDPLQHGITVAAFRAIVARQFPNITNLHDIDVDAYFNEGQIGLTTEVGK